jgi:hypothetical protein
MEIAIQTNATRPSASFSLFSSLWWTLMPRGIGPCACSHT